MCKANMAGRNLYLRNGRKEGDTLYRPPPSYSGRRLTMFTLQVISRSFLIPSLASFLFFLAWLWNIFALISDLFIVVYSAVKIIREHAVTWHREITDWFYLLFFFVLLCFYKKIGLIVIMFSVCLPVHLFLPITFPKCDWTLQTGKNLRCYIYQPLTSDKLTEMTNWKKWKCYYE